MPPSGFFKISDDLFEEIGHSITGVDIDGDGVSDIVIGAPLGEDSLEEGKVYVIYGDPSGFDDPTFDLDDLDGDNGFALIGAEEALIAASIANAGDVNDDGQDDLIIGAGGHLSTSGASGAAGAAFVVFGTDEDRTPFEDGEFDFPVEIGDVTSIEITSGGSDDGFGRWVAPAGDVNGDGIADLIVGAPNSGATDTGTAYIVFGATGLEASDLDVSALDGTDGFTLTGAASNDFAGWSVTGIGDFNDDGIDDLAVGSPGAGGTDDSGAVHVIYGRDDDIATLDLGNLTATDGITISGTIAGEEAGFSISGSGDFNDDGLTDLIIGAPLSGTSTGAIYVVYGADDHGATLDVDDLNGLNGFSITGLASNDFAGYSVANLGDVSGDGIDDFGIAGIGDVAYIVYGNLAGFGASLDLTALNGSNGLAISGLFDGTFDAVEISSLGDINSDGINDIGIGAANTSAGEGEVTVLLGGTANLDALDAADGTTDNTIAVDGIVTSEFVDTDVTIIVSGVFSQTITEDDTTVSGIIDIEDTDEDPDPTFTSIAAAGAFGAFTFDPSDPQEWTYTVNQPALLDALDGGDVVIEQTTVTASNGTVRNVTVAITGIDDVSVFAGDLAASMSEDDVTVEGSATVSDVDEDDTPEFVATSYVGDHGTLEIDANGDYTYTLTDPDLQSLNNAETDTDEFTVLADDGNSTTITVTIDGANEGVVNPGGTPGADTINTGFGDDIINADGGDDTVNSGAGDDEVNGGAGNDAITDAVGDDDLDGGADNDVINAISGDNTLDGGTGNDVLLAGYGKDALDGGDGNDILDADSDVLFLFGGDIIIGGAGDDIMRGGKGGDTFVFADGFGDDTIGDFDRDAINFTDPDNPTVAVTGSDFQVGIDQIDLTAVTGVNAGNVLSLLSDVGGNAVLTVAGQGSITFTDIDVADLTADDFFFL